MVAATTSNGTGPDSSPSNAVTPVQGGNYHPLAPMRILDTRAGVGAPTGRLGPGGSLTKTVLIGAKFVHGSLSSSFKWHRSNGGLV